MVVDGSVLRKNPAIVNANLAAAQQAWDSLSLTDRLFDHYGEGPSISRQLDLARADMREFNRWEDELPASTVINVLRNLDAYDASQLDAPVGDVIHARGFIQMVNRYYMGDEPFVIGPPSQAEVAFATRNAVDLRLAMMGLSAMTAGHLTRWSGQSEERVLMAGQSARAMADIVTAAHIQSNGRAQSVSTMASVRRPRVGGVANSPITREGIVGGLGEVVEPHLGTISKLDADALVGFRGSLARGFKGEHKGGAPFDPGNFDVDAFIVSDKLAGQFGSRVRFRSGAEIDGIAGVQSSIDASLRQSPVFGGLRQDPFTFRIYTQQEIMRLQAKPDAQTFFLKPQP